MPEPFPVAGTVQGPDGFETFRDAMWHSVVPVRLEAARPDEFAVEWRSAACGPVGVTRLDGDLAASHVGFRTASAISRGDPGIYNLYLQMEGDAVINQMDHEDLVHTGDLTLLDTTRPFADTINPGRTSRLLVTFPHDALGLDPGRAAASLVGRALPATHGVGPLLVPLLRGLGDHAADLPPASAEYAARNALDMLSIYLAELLDTPTTRDGASERCLVLSAKAHIRRHLADPDLSPADVAEAVHISLRHLQKLFADQGQTCSAWIRRQRLEHCRHRLEDPAHATISITEIAHEAGFRDSAHFSRTFKSAYGTTPRDHRAGTR
ncbi:AraC family transcriptional regulator [Thermomonospora umbrina]|uniref:AraC family transcriptional regulator n=1 Tax=Thermomonospora umbrina TaxID=111806 RepID=A0A3D9SVX6_9ACTN|nr:AraC family transcriptional regulator [Thermomonospora umbrina]